MRISDLIGNLVDIFGQTKQAQEPAIGGDNTELENRPDVQVIEPETEDRAESEVMIPPLQQKIELLKKAVDVDNFYDDEQSNTNSTSLAPINITINVPAGRSDAKLDLTVNDQPADDLVQIKKLAGIPAATIFDAGDDEPLDS